LIDNYLDINSYFYKTKLNIKYDKKAIMDSIINDYFTEDVQRLRSTGNYNFVLDSKYKEFNELMYRTYEVILKKLLPNMVKSTRCADRVWAYVSNNKYNNPVIHNHKDTATFNAVYYLNIPNAKGGELEFYDNEQKPVFYFKPEEGDFIIFPGEVDHKPLPCDSEEFRIAINMEYICV